MEQRNQNIAIMDSSILEMVKETGLLKSLQKGLSSSYSLAYQDRAPVVGSGIDGFNERLGALEEMAASQAFRVASGQSEAVDYSQQMRIWKGIAQTWESYGVFDRDGNTPNIVGAMKWRLAQDSTESDQAEAEVIAKASTLKAETIKKMRDQKALNRYQHRAEMMERAVMLYLEAEPIFDVDPINWENYWDDVKQSAERKMIRSANDSDELINDLFLLARA